MVTFVFSGDMEARGDTIDTEPMYIIDNDKENKFFMSNGLKVISDYVTLDSVMSFTDYLLNQDGDVEEVISLEENDVVKVNELNRSIFNFFISQWFFKYNEFLTGENDSSVHFRDFSMYLVREYGDDLKRIFGLKDVLFIASLLQDYKEVLSRDLDNKFNNMHSKSYNFRNVTNFPLEKDSTSDGYMDIDLVKSVKYGSDEIILYYLDSIDYFVNDRSIYNSLCRIKIKKVMK